MFENRFAASLKMIQFQTGGKPICKTFHPPPKNQMKTIKSGVQIPLEKTGSFPNRIKKSKMRILVVDGNKIEIDLLSLVSGKETVYYNGEIVSQKNHFGALYTHSQ
jgi:hypothetical protein